MIIAIIPARGGSKRIPRKNIRDFLGKPIIAYSIEAALKCGVFDRVIVSTDDDEIAKISIDFGAEVPFIRPDNLSDDYADTVSVIKHAVTEVGCSGLNDYACCIYPTAPLIEPNTIKNSLELLTGSDCDYVFPVTTYEYPIQRAVTLKDDGRVSMMNNEMYKFRSQDLDAAFHDAGQFYFGHADSWLKGKAIFTSISKGIHIPRMRVQDIDDESDWIITEMKYKYLVKNSLKMGIVNEA